MRRDTRGEIVRVMMDGRVRTASELAEELGVGVGAVWSALLRAWQRGVLFRSKEVYFEEMRVGLEAAAIYIGTEFTDVTNLYLGAHISLV